MNGISREFIDQAVVAYGEPGAKTVLEAYANSMGLAQRAMLPRPVCGVKLALKSLGPKGDAMTGNHQEGILQFAFNVDATPPAIAAVTDQYAVHEVAHLAHYYRAPDWNPKTPFKAVIREGVAGHAQATLLDERYSPEDYWNMERAARKSMDDALIDLLYAEWQAIDPSDFYEERRGFDPYSVGTYVVGMLAVQQQLSPVDLMAVSFGEYRQFVETSL